MSVLSGKGKVYDYAPAILIPRNTSLKMAFKSIFKRFSTWFSIHLIEIVLQRINTKELLCKNTYLYIQYCYMKPFCN